MTSSVRRDGDPGLKDLARRIFASALAEASIARAFDRHVDLERGGVLRAGEDLFDLNDYSRRFVVSIGKAANTMVEALAAKTGELFEGIIASSVAPQQQIRGYRYFLGGHPTPNADSVLAGDAALRALHSLDQNSLVLFLISGGGSLMLGKPTDERISLARIGSTYRAVVRFRAPISGVHTGRQH